MTTYQNETAVFSENGGTVFKAKMLIGSMWYCLPTVYLVRVPGVDARHYLELEDAITMMRLLIAEQSKQAAQPSGQATFKTNHTHIVAWQDDKGRRGLTAANSEQSAIAWVQAHTEDRQKIVRYSERRWKAYQRWQRAPYKQEAN